MKDQNESVEPQGASSDACGATEEPVANREKAGISGDAEAKTADASEQAADVAETDGAPDKADDGRTVADEGTDPEAEVAADGEEDPAVQEISDLKDRLLRSLADMENLRRRAQKDREDALKFGAANFARDMLGVADNLNRALVSLPEDRESLPVEMASFIEGVELTERGLLSSLERHGVEKIEPMGQRFDPQFHEAMYEQPTADAEPGTVVHVLETGYIIHGRLLRPAKVAVAKALPAPPEEAPGEEASTPE